jgi:ketosteroid isomerase-like protein
VDVRYRETAPASARGHPVVARQFNLDWQVHCFFPPPVGNSTSASKNTSMAEKARLDGAVVAAAKFERGKRIVVFGTYQELVRGLTAWTETQWDNVWPRTGGFALDLENTTVLANADGTMATAIAPWTSTGFHLDGTRFERPVRATIVLVCQPDGRWLGVHSHMSLQRGIPQDSHGDRPVKAR